jgi:uncharacterized repeat protein (TIGR03806 family)
VLPPRLPEFLAAVLLAACGTDVTRLTGGAPGTRGVLRFGWPSDAGAISDAGLDGALEVEAGRREFHLPVGLGNLPAKLELTANWRLVEAFPGIGFDDPVSLIEAPGTGQLFVTEREGKVYAFENRADVTDKRLVLDLTGQNQGENDSGLLGIACHPEFGQAGSENRGYIYVHYAFRQTPIVGRPPPISTRTRSRLSRFNVDPSTLVADPESELVLIDQEDESVWHQGGALFFHPADGFLYLSVGDEGNSGCRFGNCQRIDRDLFSGILRIDVDRRGGDVSHPIARQPETGRTQGYFIPQDNPFVGQPGVLEEFYALGLRNPYRMTHDPVDDVVWIGEVGQEGREELDILAPGANYQWNVYEGSLRSSGAMPPVPLGNWTAPVLELDRRQALSIIGGYVYRGERLRSLRGQYVFADFSRGRIWALPYDVRAGSVEVGEPELLMTAEFRNRENGITSFGVDSAGELYVLTLGADAKIQKLEQQRSELNAPRWLSETGIFRDLSLLEPQPSLIAYSVQSPLWSDGASKQRWLALPEGERAEFAPSGPWEFPEGSVFVKHFALPLDEREPSRLTRLETRVLVAGEGGEFYGMTYEWNPEGTDAELVTDATFRELSLIDAAGAQRRQTWFFPGPRDCLTCHNAPAGRVLGVRTAQLNGPQSGDVDGAENELTRFLSLGLLRHGPTPGERGDLPRLSGLTDETQSLEQRVRSYWDSNCSLCHGVQTSIRAQWDARYETPLERRGLIAQTAINGGEDDATWLIEPGHPERSILYQRNATLAGDRRMPPLGSQRRDEAYLDVLARWITSLAKP